MNLIPMVVDQEDYGERSYDIYSKLLKNRIIFITGEIDDNLSNSVIAQMLYLDSINHDDIYLYINSPGGSVSAGLAIYDTMNYVKSDISTICMGIAASMGAFLLSSGKKGKRYILPNGDVMIHQVLGRSEGQASDIKISTDHILDLKNRLNKILAKNTNKSIKTIEKDTDRDNYLNAEEAIKYGNKNKEALISADSLSLTLLTLNNTAKELLERNHANLDVIIKKIVSSHKRKSELLSINDLHLLGTNNKDPLIGRDNEIQQLFSILCKKEKNNALLIGKAGVGKTALIEKLAAGLPVICSKIPPFEEVINNNHNGFIIDIKNKKAWIDCIEKISMNKKLRERIGFNAKLKSEDFSIEKMINKYEILYSEIVFNNQITTYRK